MEGSESRRAPSPTATEGKRRGDVGDVLSEATAAFTLAALALLPRRRPPTAKFIEGKKQICGGSGGETMARTPSYLPPSLPLSPLIHTRSSSMEAKERTGERTRIGKERKREGRGDFGASLLMVLTSAGSERASARGGREAKATTYGRF